MSGLQRKSVSPGSQRGPTDRAFGWQFGLILLVFGLVTAFFRNAFDLLAVFLLFLGAAFTLASLFKPQLLAPINRGWASFGRLVASVSNPLILGTLYVLVIVPVAMLGRLARRDELGLRNRDVDTFWTARNPREISWAEYFRRQF